MSESHQVLSSVTVGQVHFNSITTHGIEVVRTAVHQAVGLCHHGAIVVLLDNGSNDGTLEVLREFESTPGVSVVANGENLGFCGAHNQIVAGVSSLGREFHLLVNPDLFLPLQSVEQLLETLRANPTVGSAAPVLLRASEEVCDYFHSKRQDGVEVVAEADSKLLQTATIDSAGIQMTRTLRHFDRFAGLSYRTEFPSSDEKVSVPVFGGSGACLLLRREFVEAVSVRLSHDEDVLRVFPQLGDFTERTPLFDEAFFAYRDDAELAWRGQLLGWGCHLVPAAVAWHIRVVTPERRKSLPSFINLLGVQNRFLMQRTCYFASDAPHALVPGLFFRNLLVIVGVLLQERSSLSAFRQVRLLWRRATERRRWLKENRVVTTLKDWFE